MSTTAATTTPAATTKAATTASVATTTTPAATTKATSSTTTPSSTTSPSATTKGGIYVPLQTASRLPTGPDLAKETLERNKALNDSMSKCEQESQIPMSEPEVKAALDAATKVIGGCKSSSTANDTGTVDAGIFSGSANKYTSSEQSGCGQLTVALVTNNTINKMSNCMISSMKQSTAASVAVNQTVKISNGGAIINGTLQSCGTLEPARIYCMKDGKETGFDINQTADVSIQVTQQTVSDLSNKLAEMVKNVAKQAAETKNKQEMARGTVNTNSQSAISSTLNNITNETNNTIKDSVETELKVMGNVNQTVDILNCGVINMCEINQTAIIKMMANNIASKTVGNAITKTVTNEIDQKALAASASSTGDKKTNWGLIGIIVGMFALVIFIIMIKKFFSKASSAIGGVGKIAGGVAGGLARGVGSAVGGIGAGVGAGIGAGIGAMAAHSAMSHATTTQNPMLSGGNTMFYAPQTL